MHSSIPPIDTIELRLQKLAHNYFKLHNDWRIAKRHQMPLDILKPLRREMKEIKQERYRLEQLLQSAQGAG